MVATITAIAIIVVAINVAVNSSFSYSVAIVDATVELIDCTTTANVSAMETFNKDSSCEGPVVTFFVTVTIRHYHSPHYFCLYEVIKTLTAYFH